MTEGHVTVCESFPPMVELSREVFARFAKYITQETGIKMPESRSMMIQGRLLRRVRDLQLRSIDEYAEYFFDSTSWLEREQFINVITTNTTDFFREPEHFHYLSEVVLPEFSANRCRLGARFTAWSAGCSSGEEPYTLAMVLAEHSLRQPGFDFAILATDISTKVLHRALEGVYKESQIIPIPPELRSRYLLRGHNSHDGQVRIVPELRRRVSFHPLNFIVSEYGVKEMFDAIFFRNVMIYMERTTQQLVLQKMCRNLAPGGYLFAGHSESLAGLDVPIRPVRASIYRKPV